MSHNKLNQQYYSSIHKEYIASTQDADMQVHYDRFLPFLPNGGSILDVGFGSGRDMLYFSKKGYDVKGIDVVEEFVTHAKSNGLSVELVDYHSLPFSNEFDGIWACASLLHSDNLLLAFNNLYNALKAGGYLYVSMKLGEGNKIENGRFYQYVNEKELIKLGKNANFSIVESYISTDILNRNNNWINAILKKA